MHRVSTSRGVGVAAVLAALLSLLATSVGSVPAASASPAPSTVSFVRQCALPKRGFRACMALRRVTPAGQVTPALTQSGFGPSDLASAYNIPSTGGTGVTVAIVDAQDDPDAEADLGTYRSNYGLPACTTANGCFKKVNQTGGTTYPAADTGWAGEIMLDIEMVSAACPGCHILLVEANSASNADLDTAVNYAAAHSTIVSNSYGGNESSTDTSDTSYNHPGVLILASSGDQGYVTEFPAASPSVLAVGGTSLSRSSTTSRGWTESVWSTSSTEGAGSGCSTYETQPSWQTANPNVKAVCSKRAVADVSAVADPATGVAVYDRYGSGGWAVYGGTSVASPLIAAIFAVTGHAGTTPQYPYSNTANFYDVTSGQTSTCGNALCRATTGWDGPTGVGTPNGTAMAGGTTPSQDFSMSVAPTSGTVSAGAGATATVSTATVSGTAQSVSFSVSGQPSGVTASVSPTSVTSGSSATLSVSTSTSTAPGTYTLTITGTGTSGSHSATFSLTVTGSATSCTSAGQKLVNPGFESGSTGWTATAGVLGNVASGPDAPHTGTGFAWLDGYGTTHTDTLSQSVTIPSGCTNYTLSFWLSINTAETTTTVAYDKLTVAVNSTTEATYSNLNKGGYTQKSFNISGFAGQTVTLKFTGTEDSSLQTSFLIDDTAINVS